MEIVQCAAARARLAALLDLRFPRSSPIRSDRGCCRCPDSARLSARALARASEHTFKKYNELRCMLQHLPRLVAFCGGGMTCATCSRSGRARPVNTGLRGRTAGVLGPQRTPACARAPLTNHNQRTQRAQRVVLVACRPPVPYLRVCRATDRQQRTAAHVKRPIRESRARKLPR
jgi:hypothetical protein